MKKVASLLVITMGVFTASAQIQQGNILVGADIANLNLGLNEGSTFSVRINPKIAVFVRNGLALGGYVNFGLVTSKGAGSTVNYGLGLLGRYYINDQNINLSNRGRFFAEGTVGIEGTNPASGENTNGLGLGFGPGWTYFITHNIGFETLLKFNGIVGFGNRATSSNLNFSVGFQIYIPSSKTKLEKQ